MKPLDELLWLGSDTEPATLRLELNERQALLATLPRGGGLLDLPEPPEATRKRIAALESEVAQLKGWLYYLEQFLPAFEAGKKQARGDRAKATNAPWAKSRLYCVARAGALWADDPSISIGAMSERLLDELIARQMKAPTKPDKVRKWLKEAADLTIPDEARKPGRPPG